MLKLKLVQDAMPNGPTRTNNLPATRPQRCCQDLFPFILPLSLVRRLVGNLGHPDPAAKLGELDPPKRLGEQVRELILGVDVARLDASFLQAAPDEVVPHPDMFTPFVENGVLRQG